jgi:hypothetical protein
MKKIEIVRGNKKHAYKIKNFLEHHCDYKSNPNNFSCSCDSNFYYVNRDGEIDAKNEDEIDLDSMDIVNIDTILSFFAEDLKEDYRKVVKCNDKSQNYVDYFDDILKEMSAVHQKKNADYGNNFHKRYEKYGFLTALLRLTDKMERLENIYEKGEIQVKDESVEDTLLDLANYAVMTIVELRNNK